MQDTIHHKQLRTKLVAGLKAKGISSERVLDAISRTPRHLFMDPKVSAKKTYEDEAADIGVGQTISQPFTVAFQTQLLEVRKGDRVLEIGTGSGYQAAVLYLIGAEVYTIERQEKLFVETKRRLAYLGYSGVHVFYGDGNEGLPDHAPFDRILITAAAPSIPESLLKQLKINGIMVVPVNGSVQKMLKITRLSETHNRIEDFGKFRFVPMLPGTQKYDT